MCHYTWLQLLFLYNPGPCAQGWYRTQWPEPSHINHQSRQCPTDMPTDQSDGSSSLVEGPSSLRTLVCVQLTKPKLHLRLVCSFLGQLFLVVDLRRWEIGISHTSQTQNFSACVTGSVQGSRGCVREALLHLVFGSLSSVAPSFSLPLFFPVKRINDSGGPVCALLPVHPCSQGECSQALPISD